MTMDMDQLGLSQLVNVDLQRRWYKSPHPILFARYEHRREAARRQNTRLMTWVSVTVYIAFAPLHFIVVPDVAVNMAWNCLILGIAVTALIETLIRVKVRANVIDHVSAILLVGLDLNCLLFLGLSADTLGVTYYLAFGTLFMLVASIFFDYPPKVYLAASLAILCAFLVVVVFVIPVPFQFRIAFGTFYTSCLILGSIVNWKLTIERYNVFLNTLQAEIRQREAVARGEELLLLSKTDVLTDLENRRSIDGKLEDLWADRQNSSTEFAVILLDIDFFKMFNDGYGHQAGDRCLALVAGALAEVAATFNGYVGRYGGEEFIILAKAATPPLALGMAEAIRCAVENLNLAHMHRLDGVNIVTASLGATITRPVIGSGPATLLREADQALYAAKASGRNSARLFDPSGSQTTNDSENIAAALKVAIAKNLVSLVYQPIWEVASEQMEGVETLMRLRMPDGMSVAPSVFIPIAERTGAIIELGRWAIRTVCLELLGSGQIPFASVNVSAVQLKMPDFVASVAAILNDTGVAGNRLVLEITEGLDIETDSNVFVCIAQLKELGIRIWLDDFGTGFAGLSWLRLIDFDVVKIDRSFLHYCFDPKGQTMLQDIIGFLRKRGLEVLVEGVETPDQLSLMRDYGIDHVQGYYVGGPLPATHYLTPRTEPIETVYCA